MGRVTTPEQGIKMAVVSDHRRDPGKRDVCKGWTPAAARRCRDFLMKIDPARLPPGAIGIAYTLTVKECPPDSTAWGKARDNFRKALTRMGSVCDHWVTEWQKRGVPHLHGFAFFALEDAMHLSPFTRGQDVPTDPEHLQDMREHLRDQLRRDIRAAWLRVASEYGPKNQGQHVMGLEGLVGWAQYLAKHSSRGAEHYQRQRELLPEGWQKSGRLWGRGGHWPLSEVQYDTDRLTFYRLRRGCRRWLRAKGRQQLDLGLRHGNEAQVRAGKRVLRFRGHCGQGDTPEDKRRSSEKRGMSVFLPDPWNARMLEWASSHDQAIFTVERQLRDGIEVDDMRPVRTPPRPAPIGQ